MSSLAIWLLTNADRKCQLRLLNALEDKPALSTLSTLNLLRYPTTLLSATRRDYHLMASLLLSTALRRRPSLGEQHCTTSLYTNEFAS